MVQQMVVEQPNEILNLQYHQRRLTIKALNKAKTKVEAAELLGIPYNQLARYICIFNISYCNKQKQYIIQNQNK